MIGRAFRKLAEENGLQVNGGMAYGMLKGCMVTLSEGTGYKCMGLYIGRELGAENGEALLGEVADFIQKSAADFKRYRIMREGHSLPGLEVYSDYGALAINFFDNPGTMKCISAFIEEILPEVAAISQPARCAECGEKCSGSVQPIQIAEGVAAPIHEDCARKFLSAQQDAHDEEKRAGHTALGILGAVLGALLGAAVWAAVAMFGYMASIVGALIAFLSAKGYDLLGGRPGRLKAVVLVVCIVLAVFVGNIVPIVWELHQVFAEETLGYAQLPITEGEYMMEVFKLMSQDGEVMGQLAADMGVGLLFGFLGGYGMIRASKRGGKHRAKELNEKITM